MYDTDHSPELTFRSLLLDIDKHLGSDDVSSLKFLCSDFLPTKKLQDVTSAEKLFQHLIEQDKIEKDNMFLVAELLYSIRQYALLRKLNYTKEMVQAALPARASITPYRLLLLDISEDIGREDHEAMKFLLPDVFPKKRRETMSTLDLLSLLEAQDRLTPDKLDILESVCKDISPDLVKKIAKYKKEQVLLPCQEASPSLKAFTSLEEKRSQEESAEGACTSYPSTSVSIPCQTSDVKDTTPISQPEQDTTVNVDQALSNLSLEQSSEACRMDGSIEDFPVYKMGKTCRGHCVIINNEKFEKNTKRRGSKQDEEALRVVFSWLGLEVAVYENQTATEIWECMERFQTKINHKEMDCFVCCILSHGESGSIHSTDDKLLPIRKLASYFTGRQCPSLANKPKLFFIQACQGKSIQPVVHVEADAQGSQGRPLAEESIPNDADFLMGMATVDGFASFRNVNEGSWYIQSLCRNLVTQVPRREDILSILVKVNDEVSKEEDRSGMKKQMPQPAYTLRKKVIFPVPKNPPPNLNQSYQ